MICQRLDISVVDKIVKLLTKLSRLLTKMSRLLTNCQDYWYYQISRLFSILIVFSSEIISPTRKNLYLLITCSIFIQIENPFKLKLLGTPWCDFPRKNPQNWENKVSNKICQGSWQKCQESVDNLEFPNFSKFSGFFLKKTNQVVVRTLSLKGFSIWMKIEQVMSK